MVTPILELNNVSFGFSKGPDILHEINLSVEQGAIFGFLGANGEGKTTTIKLILGLYQPQTGIVNLFGAPLLQARNSSLSRIGALIETPSLYEHLTGFDNLEITRRIRNLKKGRSEELLKIVDLHKAGDLKVSAYSLGMKQRLALALALLPDPELLFLDEPTNGLDPSGIIFMRNLILDINKKFGTTIFISSHLLSEVEKIATHLGVINKGKIVFQGTVDQLKTGKGSKHTLKIITNDNIKALLLLNKQAKTSLNDENEILVNIQSEEEIALLNKLLVSNDFSVFRLDVQNEDLESIFLGLTENR